MIEIKNISYGFGSKKVIEKISFDIEHSQFIAILGNNGAGKSTLLKCLNGIYNAKDGVVTVSGEDVLAMHRSEAAKRMAYVAQKNESSRVTVFDAIFLGRKPYIKWDATKEDIQIVKDMIHQMDLESFQLRFIDELSGGELQKVKLARALVQQPKFLMLDEPTSNLDPKNQYEVLRNIRKIAKERGIAVAIVIHDLNLALRYCDKFLFIKDGEVFSYGGIETMTPEYIETVFNVPVAVADFNGIKVVIPVPDEKDVAV